MQISNEVVRELFPDTQDSELKVTSVTLPKDLVGMVDEIADKSNRSRSQVIASLSRMALKQLGLTSKKK